MDLSAHEIEFRNQRLAHLETLKAAGHRPYGRAFERTGSLAEVRAAFAEGRAARIAGRVVAVREMGKSIFAHVQDGTDRFQVYVQKNALGDESFAAFRAVDLGDFIGLEGELFTTRTGEPSLKVLKWELLSKALHPLPEKWHGLQDTEVRYRQRYLDLIANPDVRQVFNAPQPHPVVHPPLPGGEADISRWRRRSCRRWPAARSPIRSRHITTRSVSRCTCASRRSCI